MGDLGGALGDADAYVRFAPSESEAYVRRSSVRHELDDIRGAFEDAEQAIRLKPDNPTAYLSRGINRLYLKPRTREGVEASIRDFEMTLRFSQYGQVDRQMVQGLIDQGRDVLRQTR